MAKMAKTGIPTSKLKYLLLTNCFVTAAVIAGLLLKFFMVDKLYRNRRKIYQATSLPFF